MMFLLLLLAVMAVGAVPAYYVGRYVEQNRCCRMLRMSCDELKAEARRLGME